MTRSANLLFFLGICSVLAGCGGGGSGGGSPAARTLYKPNVAVFTSKSARSATLDGSMMTVTGDSSDIVVGTVALCGRGPGFTRKVTAVNGDGTFGTDPSTLQDAIESCDAHLKWKLTGSEVASFTPAGSNVVRDASDPTKLKVSFTDVNVLTGFTLNLTGDVTFDIALDARLKATAGAITDFGLTATTQATANTLLTVPPASAAYMVAKETLVATVVGKPHEIVPGVALTPTVRIYAETDASQFASYVESGVHFVAKTEYAATIDLGYGGGNWAADGSQTSTTTASLTPKHLSYSAFVFSPAVPRLSVGVNGVDTLTSGSYGIRMDNVTSSNDVGATLTTNAQFTAALAGDASALVPGGGAATPTLALEPAALNYISKTFAYDGTGEVTVK